LAGWLAGWLVTNVKHHFLVSLSSRLKSSKLVGQDRASVMKLPLTGITVQSCICLRWTQNHINITQKIFLLYHVANGLLGWQMVLSCVLWW
jgi:hypothetical protein